ncbi:MAG: DUF2723 domain-containing protein [Patescibacteria group bacterium]
MKAFIFLNRKSIGFLSVFFLTLLVYYLTLGRTMFWIDSAIYLTTIKEFGIAYPPGFPLYIIIAKFWSYLPLLGFNFAQKINFLSSIFASLASGVLYLIILKLSENKFYFFEKKFFNNEPIGTLIAFFSSLAFGFSHSLWYQAIYAEVYTFHIFLTALIIYFLISAGIDAEKQKRYLLGAALSFGFSFANHPMIVGLIPLFLWYLIKIRKTIFNEKKFFITLFIIFMLAGLLPYIYIPIRSLQNPVMDWGNPENFTNFVNHVTGRYWTGEKSLFVFLNQKFFENVGNWIRLSYYQFFSIGLIFSFVGLFYVFIRKAQLFQFLLLLITGAGFWATIYITGEYESWLIPAHLGLAIFMAAGFYAIFQWKFQKLNGVFKTIIILLLVFVVFGNLKNNWLTLDRRQNFYPEEAGHNILKSVEDGSIIIAETGVALNSILYNQFILGEKQNAIAIHRNSFWAPWARQNLKKYESRGMILPDLDISSKDVSDKKKRADFNDRYLEAFIKANIEKFNIYTVMPDNFKELKIIPWGFGYKYSLSEEQPDLKKWDFDFKVSRFCNLKLPTFGDFSLKKCFEAGMEIENGKGYYQPPDIQIQSNKEFEETKAGYASAYRNLAEVYFSKKDFKQAINYYERAINLFNDNFVAEQKTEIYIRKGMALLEDGQYRKAMEHFEEMNNLFPDRKEIIWNLAIAYEGSGLFGKAVNLLENKLDDKDFNFLFRKILERSSKTTKFPPVNIR